MAAFPSTPILDTGAGPTQVPMPEGDPWASGINTGGFSNLDRDGAASQFTTSDPNDSQSVWPTIFGGDQEVYARIAVLPVVNDVMGLWARVQNPETGSLRGLQLTYQSSGSLQCATYIGNTPTGILSTTITALAIGDWVGMAAIGQMVYFFTKRGAGAWTVVRNLTAPGAVKQTAANGAGQLGMGLRNTTAVVCTGRWSNFGGGVIQDAQSDVIIGGRGATR